MLFTRRVQLVWRNGHEAAVEPEDGADGQPELTPPCDVREVTERADHRDPGPLLGIGKLVGENWHLDAEERRRHGRPEEVLVPLVVGIRDERDARRDELGPRGLDDHRVSVGSVELHGVVRTSDLAVFELSLGHGGAEVHVPQRRRLRLISLAAREVAQECPL